MTPAPISVERFDKYQLMRQEVSPCAEFVPAEAYDALLHQLAETERDRDEWKARESFAVSDLQRELRQRDSKLAEREAEVERLRGLLGRCYVLAGADADGEPPERHAEGAVRAVNDLRHDYDESGDECERLRQAVMHQEGKASEWCIRASSAQRDMKEACDSWHMAFVSTVQSLLIKGGMRIGQARIHATVAADEIRISIEKAAAAFLAASGGGK